MMKIRLMCRFALLFVLLLFETAAASGSKALKVPELSSAQVKLDGRMSEVQWQQAAVIEDFYQFNSVNPANAKISARIWHDGKTLYVGTSVPYSVKVKLKPWTAKVEVLAANTVEPRFFNSYVWYGGRGRSASLRESRWSAVNRFNGGEWISEAAIPLSELKLNSGGFRFNIHITPPGSKTAFIWENCGRKLYNIERFGELLLIDYNAAAIVRKAVLPGKPIDRAAYQALPVPGICEVECGPWLHAPDRGRISVGFISSTPCRVNVLYRVKGESKWQSQSGDLFYGARTTVRRNHNAHLSGLRSGKTYEYRLQLISPDGKVKKLYPADKSYSFTMPADEKNEFKFALFSDIHNFRARLDKLMPHTEGCDFLVNLGDMVNIANSPSQFLDGYLKGELEYAAAHPLVNLRGNHEFRGLTTEIFSEYFGTPDGKPYFISRWGNLCLIGLDSGEDGRDKDSLAMLAVQREWLKQAVKCDAFKTAEHRIILIHIPPMKSTTGSTQRVQALIKDVFTGPQAEKVDVMLAGHTHIASITPANSTECFRYEPEPNKIQVVKMPFPVICNSGMGNTMLRVEVKGKALTVVMLLPDGKELARHKIK